jgi:hypothetical protein
MLQAGFVTTEKDTMEEGQTRDFDGPWLLKARNEDDSGGT